MRKCNRDLTNEETQKSQNDTLVMEEEDCFSRVFEHSKIIKVNLKG